MSLAELMIMSNEYQGSQTEAIAVHEIKVSLKVCFKEKNKGKTSVHSAEFRPGPAKLSSCPYQIQISHVSRQAPQREYIFLDQKMWKNFSYVYKITLLNIQCLTCFTITTCYCLNADSSTSDKSTTQTAHIVQRQIVFQH